MALSNDLLSQFAKVTKSPDAPKKETTAYGKIVKRGDSTYVKLDGSEILTPVLMTANAVDGERVTVQIKNHVATVTGNISSPSARVRDVKDVKDVQDGLNESYSELVIETDKISSNVTTLQTSVENQEQKIVVANSLITQLSDMISNLVQDENGESLMVQTSTGWSYNMSVITDTLESHARSIANFDNHINFGSYIDPETGKDEPCIEFWENSSNFKVIITNKRILFQEGSAVPTYICDNTLVTENIRVKKELQQGGFIWKIRSNGNLSLSWKGVTE